MWQHVKLSEQIHQHVAGTLRNQQTNWTRTDHAADEGSDTRTTHGENQPIIIHARPGTDIPKKPKSAKAGCLKKIWRRAYEDERW